MAAKKAKKKPSAKQLAARRKFAAAAKARAKKAAKKKTGQRNKTIIKKAKKVIVLNPKKKAKNPILSRKLEQTVYGVPVYSVVYQRPNSSAQAHGYAVGDSNKFIRYWKSAVAAAKRQSTSKTKNPILSRKLKQTVYGIPIYDVWYQRPNSSAMAYGYAVGDSNKFIRHWKSAVAAAKRLSTGKAKNPKKRRNSSSTAIDNRKEFAGKYSGDLTLHFPQKSLTGLSTLGPLVSLQGEFGTIKPTKGGVYYCQDAKGRIHIGAKSDDDLWARVKENLGAVHRVEYRAAKPHLGYPQVITWYHDFEAPYPILKSDGQGGLLQTGGGYKIKREGIVG